MQKNSVYGTMQTNTCAKCTANGNVDYNKNTYNVFVIIDQYITGTDLNTQKRDLTDIPLDDCKSIYN